MTSTRELAMQPIQKRWLIVPLLLVLGSVALADFPTPEPSPKDRAAQQAVLYLASQMETEDVSDLAQKLVREHDSENISSVFKVKRKGGLGTGILPPERDGIERVLLMWEKKAPSKQDLDKYHAEAQRMADVIRVMSELAPIRMAARKVHSRPGAPVLQQVLDEFKAAAADFQSAVSAKDSSLVKKSAGRLGHTCCDCHSFLDF
jgi:hypothetical protein